jgi:hypothetical protein
MADFTGSTLLDPGFLAAGAASEGLASADFSGSTTASPALEAIGAGSLGIAPGDFAGSTTASPGLVATGVSSGSHQTTGAVEVLMSSSGAASIPADIVITGSGAPQALTARSAGLGSAVGSITGLGSAQALTATSGGVGLSVEDFESQGVADAFVETYLKSPTPGAVRGRQKTLPVGVQP